MTMPELIAGLAARPLVLRTHAEMGLGLEPGEYHALMFHWTLDCGFGVDDLMNSDTDLERFTPFAVLARGPIPLAAQPSLPEVLHAARVAAEAIRAAAIDDARAGAVLLGSPEGVLWVDHLVRLDPDEGTHSGYCTEAAVSVRALVAALGLDSPLRGQFRRFLCGECAAEEFEPWVYATAELEQALGPADHLALLSIDYRHGDARALVAELFARFIPEPP